MTILHLEVVINLWSREKAITWYYLSVELSLRFSYFYNMNLILQVDSLKDQLLEKLEQFLVDLNLESAEASQDPVDLDKDREQENTSNPTSSANGVSVNKK